VLAEGRERHAHDQALDGRRIEESGSKPPQLYGGKIGRDHRRDAYDDKTQDHPFFATI